MSNIQVSHLTFGYEGNYENVFEDVSFTIDTDWEIGSYWQKWKRKNYSFKFVIRQIHLSRNYF